MPRQRLVRVWGRNAHSYNYHDRRYTFDRQTREPHNRLCRRRTFPFLPLNLLFLIISDKLSTLQEKNVDSEIIQVKKKRTLILSLSKY